MIKTEYLALVLILSLMASRSYSQPRPPAKWKEYQDSLNHFLKLKDLNQCIFYYDKLIALDPRSTYLILGKGTFLYSVEEYRLAIREFTKVLKMNNEIADGHVRRGKAYLCLSQYDSALTDFNSAYGKYRHQDSAIFLYRGCAYDLMGNRTKAQLEYDSALAFHKSKKEFHKNLGSAKFELGDLRGALGELNKAIQIDKNYLPAIGNRALVNLDLEDFDNCIRDSKQYLKSFPRNGQINYVAGVIYYSKKDYHSALPHLDECKSSLATKEVFIMSGMTHYYLVQDQKAIDDFTRALEFELARSQQADLHYLIGICLNNMNPGSGCPEISKAIQIGHPDAERNYKEACK